MNEVEQFIEDMKKIITAASTPTLASRLKSLETEAKPLLKSLRAAVTSADRLPGLDMLKPEYTEERKTQHVTKAREAVFNCLKRYIHISQAAKANATGLLFNYTQRPDTKDPLEKLSRDSRDREIRQVIRSLPNDEKEPDSKLSKRTAFVMKVVQGNDKDRALSFIHALVGSPEDLMGEDLLSGLRINYARVHAPELYESMTTATSHYDQIRRACGMINAECIRTLGDVQDPVTEAERQSVFVPQGWYEQSLGEKRLQKEEREKDRKERDRELEQSQTKAMGLTLAAAHQAA